MTVCFRAFCCLLLLSLGFVIRGPRGGDWGVLCQVQEFVRWWLLLLFLLKPTPSILGVILMIILYTVIYSHPWIPPYVCAFFTLLDSIIADMFFFLNQCVLVLAVALAFWPRPSWISEEYHDYLHSAECWEQKIRCKVEINHSIIETNEIKIIVEGRLISTVSQGPVQY